MTLVPIAGAVLTLDVDDMMFVLGMLLIKSSECLVDTFCGLYPPCLICFFSIINYSLSLRLLRDQQAKRSRYGRPR